MRIGLTQRVEQLADRDERRDCLDQAWARLLLDAGFVPVPLPNQPGHARALVEALQISGVILTGGNDLACLPDTRDAACERDAFERELLELCSQGRLAVLGVCRGMQMIVNSCGGRLERVADHVRKPHPLIARESAMPIQPRTEVNSFHNFGTRPELLGDELAVTAMAADGTVEAVAHATLPMWGIMWHPERPVAPGGGRDDRDVAIIRTLFGGKRS